MFKKDLDRLLAAPTLRKLALFISEQASSEETLISFLAYNDNGVPMAKRYGLPEMPFEAGIAISTTVTHKLVDDVKRTAVHVHLTTADEDVFTIQLTYKRDKTFIEPQVWRTGEHLNIPFMDKDILNQTGAIA